MLKCFPKNIHSNGILLMSHYLNNVTAIYLTEFADFLYIVVAFTYLDICLFLSRAARMFISLFWAGLFVCASAHSGELSCWEIQMSHSVFRFPVPYLFPMRKPWIKDLCPIGPKPTPTLSVFWLFLPWNQRKEIIFIEWSIKKQSVISQLTAKNIILCTNLNCLSDCKFLLILKCLRGC